MITTESNLSKQNFENLHSSKILTAKSDCKKIRARTSRHNPFLPVRVDSLHELSCKFAAKLNAARYRDRIQFIGANNSEIWNDNSNSLSGCVEEW